MSMANFRNGCDRSRLFEQDFWRSWRHVASFRQRALAASCFIPAPPGHGGYSVQYLSATYSSYNILNSDRNMWCCPAATVPLSWANQYEGDRPAPLRPLTCVCPSLDKTALSEKMSKFFFGDRNYCDRTAPRFTS